MQYRNKETGEVVEAIVWEGDNGTAVANMMGGSFFAADGRVPLVDYDDNPKQVSPGRWISKERDGFHVYSPADFVEKFNEVSVTMHAKRERLPDLDWEY